MISIGPLIEYYEALVRADDEQLVRTSPNLRDRVYRNQGMWEHRVILRQLREKAGISVCWGAVDCLKDPTSRCKTAQRATCQEHINSCYLCVTASATQPTG